MDGAREPRQSERGGAEEGYTIGVHRITGVFHRAMAFLEDELYALHGGTISPGGCMACGLHGGAGSPWRHGGSSLAARSGVGGGRCSGSLVV